MTHNQIEYWKLQEQKRSNLANEGETNRSNVAKEQENYRHNVATENEAYRHNTVGEAQVWNSQRETQRHNIASENLTAENIDTQRARNADLAWKESMDVLLHNESNRETQRHNMRDEYIEGGRKMVQNVTDMIKAPAAAWKDINTGMNQQSGILKNWAQGIGSAINIFKHVS